MAGMKHGHASLIEQLGGSARVAELLGMSGARPDSTVDNWSRRGIAWHWRPRFAEIARTEGVALPADFLESRAA